MKKYHHPLLIVGSGRLSKHIAHYFKLLGIEFLNWNRQNHSVLELTQIIGSVDRILLAISDDALEMFVNDYLNEYSGSVVHFSGALEIKNTLSAHPLMTFSHELYNFEDYTKIPFVTTQPARLREVLPDLPNPIFQINSEDKSLYHATCVYSGNFTNLIWNEAFKQFKRLGLPEEAILPYLDQTFKNIKADPFRSLTGPFARKDFNTISKNLNSLDQENQKMKNIYSIFMENYL